MKILIYWNGIYLCLWLFTPHILNDLTSVICFSFFLLETSKNCAEQNIASARQSREAKTIHPFYSLRFRSFSVLLEYKWYITRTSKLCILRNFRLQSSVYCTIQRLFVIFFVSVSVLLYILMGTFHLSFSFYLFKPRKSNNKIVCYVNNYNIPKLKRN